MSLREATSLPALLGQAEQAGREALALLTGSEGDLDQVTALLAARQEYLAAAAASLARTPPAARQEAAALVAALEQQQAALASAGARRRERLHLALLRIREASARLSGLQAAARATAGPRLLDRRG